MLSSWSKSFSCKPEKTFRAVDVHLMANLTSFARVYELNLNWHIENLFFTCTWFSFRPQTFNSYNQDLLVKLRRIAVLVVVAVILFRRHASDQFQEAISWSRTWRFFLHCLSLKYVVSDHFRWGNIPVNQNKLRMCLHFDQIPTRHRSFLFLRLVHLWGLWKLFHTVKQWLKSSLRDHWSFTTVQSR